MKLNEYLKKTNQTASCVNIDDIFYELRGLGIKEVELDYKEMGLIVQILLANGGILGENNERAIPREELIRLWREGEVNRFLGINLKLSE